MKKVLRFHFPTAIRFGAGAIHELGGVLKGRGLTKPLLIGDQGICDLPFFQSILSQLKSAGFDVAVYGDFSGNPVERHVVDGVKAFRRGACDSCVIVGGGAALDVGKAVALMAHHPGTVFDYEDGNPHALPVNQPIPFMVAIPTTAGTGSEVGRAAVISEDDTKAKRVIFDPQMLPPCVIADPELTVKLPPAITAATGIDALTHCVEAYLVNGFHPMCDGIALEGIRLIQRSLIIAVKEGANVDARADMLAASMMGAVAFQKGLGVTHSCAHALSTVFDTHHGLANALMIRACMVFNRPCCSEKFAQLDQLVGGDFVDWLGELKEEVGLPSGLGEMGVSVTDRLLDCAQADWCHPANPRPVTRDDFRALYQASM